MKKAGLAIALATAMTAPSASAFEFLTNWTLDLDGDGIGVGDASQEVPVNEYLDLTGNNFLELTQTAGPLYSFDATGVFQSTGRDGSSTGWPAGSLANELTLAFSGTGDVLLGSAFQYDSGTLEIWLDTAPDYGTGPSQVDGIYYGSNNGTLLASLSLITGTGTVDTGGVPNGTATLTFSVDTMLAGYFFDDMGNDLSVLAGQLPPVLFGFSTTNASLAINPTQVLLDELVTEFAGGTYTGVLPDGANASADFIVSTNGQFRFAIPEPAPLALLGLGLIGLGLRRKMS